MNFQGTLTVGFKTVVFIVLVVLAFIGLAHPVFQPYNLRVKNWAVGRINELYRVHPKPDDMISSTDFYRHAIGLGQNDNSTSDTGQQAKKHTITASDQPRTAITDPAYAKAAIPWVNLFRRASSDNTSTARIIDAGPPGYVAAFNVRSTSLQDNGFAAQFSILKKDATGAVLITKSSNVYTYDQRPKTRIYKIKSRDLYLIVGTVQANDGSNPQHVAAALVTPGSKKTGVQWLFEDRGTVLIGQTSSSGIVVKRPSGTYKLALKNGSYTSTRITD